MAKNLEFFPKGYYPKLLEDSYSGLNQVKAWYPNAGPAVDFGAQIQARKDFSPESRTVLRQELLRQYGDLASGLVLDNIEKLAEANTFTVTTGQQIHIFLGPLYVIYKALTTIKLATRLQQQHPECQFVPMFWMASEDHDFEEINHVKIYGKEFRWEAENGGPVGRMATQGVLTLIDEIANQFAADAGVQNALTIFREAYNRSENLADATRFLLNHFFGGQGLVVIDPDAAAFKSRFAPSMALDIENSEVAKLVTDRSQEMKVAGYDLAIHGRSPNVFVINGNARERLDRIDTGFQLKQSGLQFQSAELLQQLYANPASFSPNVALRPVYQETILPNLAYVAGPGEYTYWNQLQPVFAYFNLPVPALLARDSYILTDAKSDAWLEKNGWKVEDLFENEVFLKEKFTQKAQEENPLDSWKLQFQSQFEAINTYLYTTQHPDLKAHKKLGDEYLKMLQNLRSKQVDNILENKQYAADWNRLLKIKHRYFEVSNPQERSVFFLEQYAKNTAFLDFFVDAGGNSKYPLSLVQC